MPRAFFFQLISQRPLVAARVSAPLPGGNRAKVPRVRGRGRAVPATGCGAPKRPARDWSQVSRAQAL